MKQFKEITYWLSYGGGVNSTALAVLLCDGKLPRYQPWRIVFSDTFDEKPETYDYIDQVMRPYLRKHGKVLETCCDKEGVIERWERLGVTGSRTLRTCTSHAKIRPLERHLKAHGNDGDVQLIGIDAGEPHRARGKKPSDPFQAIYPLVELDIDRVGCLEIIQAAGLPVPIKSGCWHCPFMRVGEIIELGLKTPERFDRIDELEQVSIQKNPPDPGKTRAHWADKPASHWRQRVEHVRSQGSLFDDPDADEPNDEIPCNCYDG